VPFFKTKSDILKETDLEKLRRYSEGLADEGEKAWVESQFLNGEENPAFRHHLEIEWNALLRDSSQPEVDLNHLLDRVHHMIHTREDLKKRTLMNRFTRIYMRIAAIMVIPLMVAGGLIYFQLSGKEKAVPEKPVVSTIFAPRGARVSFVLPDGTSGMLNSNSKLTYSMPFSPDRQIDLEGEAWFDVFRDEHHPFEIRTGNSSVKVLGTTFNMMAYPDENYVEVVLQSGAVDFIDKAGNNIATVHPSERLVFRGGKVSKNAADPAKYVGWTRGRMIFNNDPMGEVARRIERWYNVEVVLADRELENYSFRGTFEDDRLDEVFRLLSMTSPITYKITPRRLLPDGTYQKEKVTIHLKNNPKI
jgi:ferric-dicitrate binding protein FerR (iron transport regulator)